MPVKYLSSYNLGVWRGAYRKPKKIRLADTIELGSYAAGYEDGARNGAAIRAAARVKRAPAGRPGNDNAAVQAQAAA